MQSKHISTEGAILEDVEGKINSISSYSPMCSSNFVKQGFRLRAFALRTKSPFFDRENRSFSLNANTLIVTWMNRSGAERVVLKFIFTA